MPHRPRWLCRTHSPIFPRSSLFGSPTAQSAQIWGGDALSGGHAPVQLAGRKVFKALYSDQILTDGRAAEIRMACSPKRVISFKWWRMETKLWETDLCPPTPLTHEQWLKLQVIDSGYIHCDIFMIKYKCVCSVEVSRNMMEEWSPLKIYQCFNEGFA